MRSKTQYFVSYAHKNNRLAQDFINRLNDVLEPSKRYNYARWQDTDLILGDDWNCQIQKAIHACHFGLLLISPAFLASSYITSSELPKFVSGDKASVPVMLHPVDFDRHNLRGLQTKQIFRLPSSRSPTLRAYAECNGYRRDAFVLELFRKIELKLEKDSNPSTRANPVNDQRILQLAHEAYRKSGSPKLFLDSQSLTNSQRAELYHKVVLARKGKLAKKNPYR